MTKPAITIAIIVTYNPDMETLDMVLQATVPQVNMVVVVDNTPIPDPNLLSGFEQSSSISLITLGDNMGIAYAQNVGIEWAHTQGADYVLLLDQDSLPSPGMVEQLKQALDSDGAKYLNAAAAGPSYVDPRSGIRSYFMVSRFGIPFRYKRHQDKNANVIIPAAFLISSGTLVPMRILLELGGMRSGYFIDHVDTEWCMRARSIGYQLIGVPNALMEHSLGDEVKRIWFLYLRNVSYHAPFRDYYMFRNTLLLLRDTRIGFAWQIVLLFRLFQFAGYFLIFASKRLSRLRCMLYGLSHGAMGISGRFDMKTGRCTTIARTKFDPQ